METKKRANASQMEKGDGRDCRHVENSPLSEIDGNRGARESSGNVGRKRLRVQLDYFDVLLFIFLVLYYSLF